MTIEEYMEQLSSELKKLVGVQPVGKVWIDFHVPRGGIPFLAQEVSRALYADLLKYVQDTGQMKTEAEWQEMYAAQNGYVPYYSDGDGVNTFRMPSMGSTYPQFASSLDDVRVFVEEGLPNITGKDTLGWSGMNHGILTNDSAYTEGAFRGDKRWANGWIAGNATTQTVNVNVPYGVGFDASKSNAIYGNSVHVTPKTGKILIGVHAIGVVTDVGSIDTFELFETVEKLNANLDNKVNKTGDIMTGALQIRASDTPLYLLDPNWAMGQVPASGEQARRIWMLGNEGEGSAVLQDIVYADGHKGFLMTHRLNTSSPWKSLILNINPDGYTWIGTDALRINFGNGTGFWIE